MKHLDTPLAKRLLGVAVATIALITPAIASAQSEPSYAVADQQIHGSIAAINDTWNISVDDANGYTDSVELHQGTIINPTGLTLEPGMQVTIDGTADGPNFDAAEIDTPYTYRAPEPAPVVISVGFGGRYPGFAPEQRPQIVDVRPQQRAFAPQQQRTFAQPQQQHTFVQPQRRAAPATRDGGDRGGDHRR